MSSTTATVFVISIRLELEEDVKLIPFEFFYALCETTFHMTYKVGMIQNSHSLLKMYLIYTSRNIYMLRILQRWYRKILYRRSTAAVLLSKGATDCGRTSLLSKTRLLTEMSHYFLVLILFCVSLSQKTLKV